MTVVATTRPRPTAASVWKTHRNASGLLYGAVVTGAVMALASGSEDNAVTVGRSVIEVLLVFWGAHVYTRVIADRLLEPNAGFGERLREALGHELALLEGGMPALVAFVVATIAGASTETASNLALGVTVVMLGSAGYVIGRASGAAGRSLVLEVAAAAGLGLLVIALKVAVH